MARKVTHAMSAARKTRFIEMIGPQTKEKYKCFDQAATIRTPMKKKTRPTTTARTSETMKTNKKVARKQHGGEPSSCKRTETKKKSV